MDAADDGRNESDAASAIDRVPYPLIWRQLAAGKVVPFLGAGSSISQAAADGQQPPSGSDLSRELADQVAFPSQDDRDRTDLAKVSSYYVDLAGRSTLRELLRERLNQPYPPARIHRLLARSPRPILTVVTNYDRLLETAYDQLGVPYEVVVYTSSADQPAHGASVLRWQSEDPTPVAIEPNQLRLDLKRHVIFKMHGTIKDDVSDWDNFVITEEDYTDFLYRMTINAAIPATFVEHFSSCSFLFLGYGLRDWNLRVILNSLRNCFAPARRGAERRDMHQDRLPSWAIQLQPSDLERRLWDNRGVKIFDQHIDTFAGRLWTESHLPQA